MRSSVFLILFLICSVGLSLPAVHAWRGPWDQPSLISSVGAYNSIGTTFTGLPTLKTTQYFVNPGGANRIHIFYTDTEYPPCKSDHYVHIFVPSSVSVNSYSSNRLNMGNVQLNQIIQETVSVQGQDYQGTWYEYKVTSDNTYVVLCNWDASFDFYIQNPASGKAPIDTFVDSDPLSEQVATKLATKLITILLGGQILSPTDVESYVASYLITQWTTHDIIVLDTGATNPPAQTANVMIYSEPHQYAGQEPSQANDLNAVLSITYSYNGVSQTKSTPTPFTVQADVGTQITISILATRVNWNFACLWDNYGVGQWSGCGSFTTQVNSPKTEIAAFFDPQTKTTTSTTSVATPSAPNCAPTLFAISPIISPSDSPQSSSAQVCIYSDPLDMLGKSSEFRAHNLGATIEADYILGGQSKTTTSNTIFGISPDVGTTLNLRVISAPQGYTSACAWEYYIPQSYDQPTYSCDLSVNVMSSSKVQSIAAFFNSQTPPQPSTCGNGQTTNVYLWALPLQYLGQDPATLTNLDIHATIQVTGCLYGQEFSNQYQTPTTIQADSLSQMWFSVVSPSGFTNTWDHYGYKQHTNTQTLQLLINQNDKVAAFFQGGPCCIIQPIFELNQPITSPLSGFYQSTQFTITLNPAMMILSAVAFGKREHTHDFSVGA